MATRVIYFTVNAWLSFFGWTSLVIAMVGTTFLIGAGYVNDTFFGIRITYVNESAMDGSIPCTSLARGQYELMDLVSSNAQMIYTGSIALLAVISMSGTLLLGTKTNSRKLLVLFYVVTITLIVIKAVRDTKRAVQTGVFPFTSFPGAMLYTGSFLLFCFILNLTYFRILEIWEDKAKPLDRENNPVTKPAESSSDSDSVTSVDVSTPC